MGTIDIRNYLRDDAGNAILTGTVEAYVSGTLGAPTTAVSATTNTAGTQGYWELAGLSDANLYDVKVYTGSQVRWQKGGISPQVWDLNVFNKVKLPAGAVGAPALTFSNDPDSGLYWIGANNLGIAVNGANMLNISTGGLAIGANAAQSGIVRIPNNNAIQSRNAANDGNIIMWYASTEDVLTTSTTTWVNSKPLFIGTASTNANMTIGLAINQGVNDDHILSLGSSDVNHGITDHALTTTYGFAKKYAATTGGLSLTGLSAANNGLQLRGFIATAADTTKSTAGLGAVIVNAALKSGTGVGDVGSDGNLLVVRNNATTRFIFDVEGSFHADVESTTFDTYDDVALLNALDAEFNRRRSGITEEFGTWLGEHKAILQQERIANFYDDGPRVMVNFTRLAMLHTGAIRQLGRKLDETLTRLALAESRLAALPAA